MRFAVATFQRVFDTVPNRDVVGLERLVRGLTTFLVKPKTLDAVEREEARIEAAWQSFRSGEYAAGRYWSRLSKAWREAEQSGGGEAAEAAEREYRHLLTEARSAPKRDLRLWSPALYREDAKRGGERVLHLSCLVLDYDGGVPIDKASVTWEEYFHIVHTTWSHTPEQAKFRLILPLAEPVRPEDWYGVYEWAQRRADHQVDPTGKSLGTTFALPTVSAADRPRVAFSAPGPLLDARVENLIKKAADPPPVGLEPYEPNHFRIPIIGHQLVSGSFGEPAEDAWDDSIFPWT